MRRDGPASGSRRGPRKPRVKQAIIEERGYKNLELEQEDYTEFAYRPTRCSQDYRVVVLRKTINVKQGQDLLCLYCRTPIPIGTVGDPGGCNPIPLPAIVDQRAIRVRLDQLDAHWRKVGTTPGEGP